MREAIARDAGCRRGIELRARHVGPPFVGRPFWMDSALLAAAGVDTVIMGPTGAGAHAKEEWVDLGSVQEMAHILAQTAMDYCG